MVACYDGNGNIASRNKYFNKFYQTNTFQIPEKPFIGDIGVSKLKNLSSLKNSMVNEVSDEFRKSTI